MTDTPTSFEAALRAARPPADDTADAIRAAYEAGRRDAEASGTRRLTAWRLAAGVLFAVTLGLSAMSLKNSKSIVVTDAKPLPTSKPAEVEPVPSPSVTSSQPSREPRRFAPRWPESYAVLRRQLSNDGDLRFLNLTRRGGAALNERDSIPRVGDSL